MKQHNYPQSIVRRAEQMRESDWAAWAKLRDNSLALQSPFTRPVGAPMSDYHAIITNRDDITYDSLLGETGIGAYHYSCAADPQRLRMPQILAPR